MDIILRNWELKRNQIPNAEEKLTCSIYINRLNYLLKISCQESWHNTYCPDCPTYLPAVLNLDLLSIHLRMLIWRPEKQRIRYLNTQSISHLQMRLRLRRIVSVMPQRIIFPASPLSGVSPGCGVRPCLSGECSPPGGSRLWLECSPVWAGVAGDWGVLSYCKGRRPGAENETRCRGRRTRWCVGAGEGGQV